MANGPERGLGRDPFAGLDWSPDAEAEPEDDRILTRDPFEGLDLEPEPEPEPVEASPEREPAPAEPAPPPAAAAPAWTAADEAELDVRLETVEYADPAVDLRGKGVWLFYSGDVDRAVEMAREIGATTVLCKTGHQGMFFVESARRIHDQMRQAGLTPLAWASIHLDNPVAEAKMAVKSAQVGYEGFVFRIDQAASGKALAAKTLGWQLLEANFDPGRLYYAAPADLGPRADFPCPAIDQFCRGGFMPLCSPASESGPRTVIDEWIYGARLGQPEAPPIYPVLGVLEDGGAAAPDAPEFLKWAQVLEDHDPAFFSVYHVGTIGRQLWPILAAMGRPAPAPTQVTRPVEEEREPAPPVEPPPPPAVEPEPISLPERFPLLQPEPEPEPEPESEPAPAPPLPSPEPSQEPSPPTALYHKVTVNDTVWGICRQYGIDKAQFWKWNGHLWDEVGMPRDTLYLQDGWRVRVG